MHRCELGDGVDRARIGRREQLWRRRPRSCKDCRACKEELLTEGVTSFLSSVFEHYTVYYFYSVLYMNYICCKNYEFAKEIECFSHCSCENSRRASQCEFFFIPTGCLGCKTAFQLSNLADVVRDDWFKIISRQNVIMGLKQEEWMAKSRPFFCGLWFIFSVIVFFIYWNVDVFKRF